jgi:hypothetical protein
MRGRRSWAVVAVAVGLALLAAGCGGSGSDKPRIVSAEFLGSRVKVDYEAPGEWRVLLMSVREDKRGVPPYTYDFEPVEAGGEATVRVGDFAPGTRLEVYGSVIKGAKMAEFAPIYLTTPG